MKGYKIISPSGQTLYVSAHSYYHAIQLAVIMEDWQFTNADYFKLNPKPKQRRK
jgi:hypothetical protein